MLWLAILFAKNGVFWAMYLNLDGTLGISSLLSGDNGDVRTNRVGRVEVGRQLWYFGIRLVMMIHRNGRSWEETLKFLAVQDSSIGDLVTHSLTV